ncbi:MAG: sulfatase-like hydrolase/transferase, partial [Deltaproteobacteria bacterium]|nr:sulfatase-like hydrolase/transferase [Deltaproteobacteria bacterium]
MQKNMIKMMIACLAVAGCLAPSLAFGADQLSKSYEGFQGKVGRTLAESEPWWPERPKAPAGAPNVIIVLADDMGFSDPGCYGSEIETPNLDRLAENGVRFNSYMTHPLCSPTRAALLTGRNSHAVGAGWIANNDPGFPGYGGEIDLNTPTIAEILRENGYTTMMVGKWHNTLEFNSLKAGDNRSWPAQRGFDYAYYFMEGETNFWAPSRLQNGNDLVDIDQYPKDYYATDDWTDRSIQWIKEHVQASPDKPFFLYLAHNAPHAPLKKKKKDMAKYRGTYDKGWDAIRKARHQRQLELGIIPEGTKLAPRNPGVK